MAESVIEEGLRVNCVHEKEIALLLEKARAI